jgi:hypothetical protein
MRIIALSAIVAAAMAAGGCGLISSDVTSFDLTLPDKTFTVDTAQWKLQPASGNFPAIDCSADAGVCSTNAAKACKTGQCSGSCDATSHTCDLQIAMQLWQMVDLVTEKPELKTINDQPLVGVHIDKLEYQVTENSLNVDTPELAMYVAPATVMSPGPQAVQIATIPPVKAGAVLPLTAIELGPDGQAALAKFMGDYQTPFNLIVGSAITEHKGDAVPTGRLTAKLKVTAHANLGG